MPQVAVGHRLGQVTDLQDRPRDRPRDEDGNDPAEQEPGERAAEDPGQPGRVRGRAAVAAGRGLPGEELVELGDPRHALVDRGLRLDERQCGAAVGGVDLGELEDTRLQRPDLGQRRAALDLAGRVALGRRSPARPGPDPASSASFFSSAVFSSLLDDSMCLARTGYIPSSAAWISSSVFSRATSAAPAFGFDAAATDPFSQERGEDVDLTLEVALERDASP